MLLRAITAALFLKKFHSHYSASREELEPLGSNVLVCFAALREIIDVFTQRREAELKAPRKPNSDISR
jgi:hypothetical protein